MRFHYDNDVADTKLSIRDVIARIIKLNDGLREFWSNAEGWAPLTAAELMSKSRLDWQVSLSRSLHHWVLDDESEIECGDLILGWANLGSLIEGTIKLYLSVYYEDYKNDVGTLKQTKAWHHKKQQHLEPDGLQLGALIDYCEKARILSVDHRELAQLVQVRRNAIHAYKDRPIGTTGELHEAIKQYLSMLRYVNDMLPYPDDLYKPIEF
jgi:hypothetical protein